jgi:AraC-like DNA-binding protein
MPTASARYREFAPCEALREQVRCFFSFSAPAADDVPGRAVTREVRFGKGDPFCAPLFADGHVSMVFSFGTKYRVEGLWDPSPSGPRGHIIGAMSAARPTSFGERREVGVHFRAAQAPLFLRMPAHELTNRIVAVADLWGAPGSALETRLAEANGDSERLGILESELLERLTERPRPQIALDVPGQAAWVLRRRGLVTVEGLAGAAGVSRQHLTRAFRETVGVTPKLYCRLARFQAGLVYAGRGKTVDWAEAALEMGYADQSHMIAEFREFSGLTPETLLRQRRFHPFMERASRPEVCERIPAGGGPR